MKPNTVLDVKKLLGGAILCVFCDLSWAQSMCQIKVTQSDTEIVPINIGGVSQYLLQPKEFRLEVSPAACAPTIATIADTETAKQIAKTPLVYSHRWAFIMAANDTDANKLLWWAPTKFDPQFLKAPEDNTFEGKQYLQLCDELKFCPNVYPTYSSGTPFRASGTGAKSEALFTRLDETQTFDKVKGKSVLSVIYTVWRALPSQYPMAEPNQLLFQPNFINFIFLKDPR